MGMMPKRGCDIKHCEISRFYRLHTSGFCEILSFTVPRKSDQFQDDLYPNTMSDVPAISAEEWVDGKEAEPILVSLKEGFVPSRKQEFKVTKKSNILDKMPKQSAQAASAASDKKMDELLEEMRKMKGTLIKHERRIRELERKMETPLASKEPSPGPVAPPTPPPFISGNGVIPDEA
ncbi:coronin-1C-like isoform X2 [Limulus polyphemus]|uniref:Coronin-1C-like isoform X2 n=1 Tax=Limulus polyphemus TaxID=6850 RepID=A0ABM1C0W5_LIMPO|nr:coronin-1C-like isoform X2 [Limulus polyphemus]